MAIYGWDFVSIPPVPFLSQSYSSATTSSFFTIVKIPLFITEMSEEISRLYTFIFNYQTPSLISPISPRYLSIYPPPSRLHLKTTTTTTSGYHFYCWRQHSSNTIANNVNECNLDSDDKKTGHGPSDRGWRGLTVRSGSVISILSKALNAYLL